jgi:hypothetical protein
VALGGDIVGIRRKPIRTPFAVVTGELAQIRDPLITSQRFLRTRSDDGESEEQNGHPEATHKNLPSVQARGLAHHAGGHRTLADEVDQDGA